MLDVQRKRIARRAGVFAASLLLIMSARLEGRETIVVPRKPLEGTTVTVACPTPVLESLVTAYSKPWLQKTGARLKTVQYDRLTGSPASASADAWILAPTDLGLSAAAGQL